MTVPLIARSEVFLDAVSRSAAGAFIQVQAYLFNATFSDGLTAEVQVNPEFGSVDAAREASPAALRLKLRRVESALQIDVVKCRGGRSGMSVKVEAPCSGCA